MPLFRQQRPSPKPAPQIRREGDRVVVITVVGEVDQRYASSLRTFEKGSPRSLFRAQFGRVSPLELPPAPRIVSEPAAERSTRGYVTHPSVDSEILLTDTARPESVDEEPGTVAR